MGSIDILAQLLSDVIDLSKGKLVPPSFLRFAPSNGIQPVGGGVRPKDQVWNVALGGVAAHVGRL